MFLNPFHNAFGLDIGDRSIKIAQLRYTRTGLKTWRYQPRHFSKLSLPPGWIVDGELQKPEEVVKALTEHLAKQKDGLTASPWVMASLPETKSYIQLITIKKPEDGYSVAEAVLEAAPSYLPYDLDDIYLDWQILKETEEKTAVLVAAIPKRIADSYTYLLNIAGLTPLALEVEACAITRAVINRRKDLAHEARGILDLGETRSSFIIYDNGMIQFSLSLSFSGQEVTEKISTALKLEQAEAENLKKEYGLNGKKGRGQLKKVLEEALEDLTTKISQAIHFYRLHFPEKHPLTGIRLCGGGANLPALENYLSAKLKIKVRKANPWVNLFSPDRLPLDSNRSLSYTTAIGLAMRAAESPLYLE